MHEGDHSILGHDHEHNHNAHPDHEHHHAQKTGRAPRTFAALIVAAGVAIFLVWRFF